MTGPSVLQVRFTPASPSEVRSGLLGHASCVVIGVLRLDGIAVRRTRSGDRRVSLPARRGAKGREYPYFMPLGPSARLDLEEQILAAVAAELREKAG